MQMHLKSKPLKLICLILLLAFIPFNISYASPVIAVNPIVSSSQSNLITHTNDATLLGTKLLAARAIGLPDAASNVLGAFVSGAIQGLVNPVAGATSILNSVIQTGAKFAAMQGVRELGAHLGIDGPLSNILAITTGSLMQGNAFNKVFPQIAGELSFYGVTKVGERIGIDPRINQILGIPIQATVTGLTGDKTPQAIGNAIKDGLKQGVTSVAIDYVGQKAGLSPLATALTSRALTGAIEGALGSKNIFEGIATAIAESTKNLFGNQGSSNDPTRIAKVLELSQIIKERGLTSALEDYASAIFQRDTVTAIWKQGGIADLIDQRIKQGKITDVTLDSGTKAKEIALLDDTSIITSEDGKQLLGVTEKGTTKEGSFVSSVDKTKGALKDGVYRYTLQDGTKVYTRVKNGQVTYVRMTENNRITGSGLYI